MDTWHHNDRLTSQDENERQNSLLIYQIPSQALTYYINETDDFESCPIDGRRASTNSGCALSMLQHDSSWRITGFLIQSVSKAVS